MVFVVAWAIQGGAERGALGLMRQLLDYEGAGVDVLALTGEQGRFRAAVEGMGIRWHTYPVTWHGGKADKARSLAGLARRLRALHPDVVAPYTSRPNVLCGLVWRTTGASLCVWNQQDLAVPTKFSRTLMRRAARMTPLLVANSRAAGDFLVSHLDAHPERVSVILEGVQEVEPQSGGAAWRARHDIPTGALVVSMLAHLHRGKDHETLLRSWRLVLDQLTRQSLDAVLLLAGRPAGTEEAVKALAFDLELGRSVRFLGDVTDVGGLLEATDIAVLSSPSESAPYALLECMSAGLPVAGTDVAGIREIVGSPQHPFLAPPGDAGRLAEAIVALALDSGLRKTLGDENRRHVLARAPVPAPEATAATIAEALARRTRS